MNKNLFIVFIFTILIIFTCSGTIFAVDSQSHTKINTTKNTKLTNSTNSSVSPQNSALVSSNSNSGLVPIPIDLSYLKGSATSSSKTSTVTANADSLPSSYDLRTQGKVTSVKNQGSLGTCWAFATYGSLESCLLPSGSYDFSENNMKNLLSSSYSDGFDRSYGGGGNFFMSTAYLARYSGPVNESDDPYNENSGVSPSGLTVQKHIQEMTIIPGRSGSTNNDNLKQAVMTYGAVYTTMYMDTNYFNYSTNSYYYSSSTTINHAVCIVGWDDNYSMYNFKTNPGYNGAFIVKNSWGTSWGESGYFYVSYYDNSFAYDSSAVFYNAEATTNYTKIYQYDPLGWTSSVGYGTNTAWGSNVFTSTGNDKLTAVSTYISSANTTYQLYIYLNPTTGNPRSGTLATTQSGTITSPGYKSIRLNTPVSLTNGQKFSVILQYTTPGYNYPIPMETPIANYSSKATASSGQSYISSNGTSWADITSSYTNTNVCIKAFTGSTQADVSMTMTASKSTLNVWEPFYYTITLYNSGPGAATNVRVTGSKPGGMQLDNYSASQGSFSNEVWTVGTLNSGSSATLYLYVTPTTGTAGLTMTYPMNETQTEYDPTPATASATVHIKKADLIITNTANQSSLNVGDTGIFTLNVTNSGPDVANIQIIDLLSQLPAGFTTGIPSIGTYNSSNGVWTITNLALGTPATLTFSGVIQAAQAGTTITNHATETQTEYPFTFTISDATIYVKEADVTLTQTGGVSNNTVSFLVTTSNSGPDDAHNVTITDTIPAGLSSPTVNVTAGSYVINSGVITWTLDLVNGGSATMTLSGTSTPQSTVTNTATKTGEDEYDPNTPDTVTTGVYTPAVSIYIRNYTANSMYDSWDMNNTPVFVADVKNNGPDDATGVQTQFTLPTGLEFIALDTRGNGVATYNSGTITWNIGYMPNGGRVYMNIFFKIKQTGSLTATHTLTHVDQTNTDTTHNTYSRTLNINLTPTSADIQVNQNINNTTPQVGDTVTITITTKNNGPDTATGVQITDLLPAGMSFQTADTHGTGTYTSSTGIWDIGTLTNGTTATLTLTATITGTGTIINTATKTAPTQSTQLDWNLNNNTKQVILTVGTPTYTPTVSLYIRNYTANSMYTGWDVNNCPVFVADVKNNGPDDATGVQTQFTLPTGLEFISLDTRGNGVATYNSGTITWDIGYMPNGGRVYMDIFFKINQSGSLTATHTLTHVDQTNTDTTHNTYSRTLNANLTPTSADIQVNQNINNTTPNLGDTVTITITTKNNGPDTATGVQITDLLPSGLQFQTADTHGTGTYTSSTGIWDIGTLTNGTTATLTLTATITGTGTIINTATKTTPTQTTQLDWNLNNNSQTTYINI